METLVLSENLQSISSILQAITKTSPNLMLQRNDIPNFPQNIQLYQNG